MPDLLFLVQMGVLVYKTLGTNSTYNTPFRIIDKRNSCSKAHSRGGHVPMGTVVLGQAPKLAFFSDFRATSVLKR